MSQQSNCSSTTQTKALTLSSSVTENPTISFEDEQSITVAVRLRPLTERDTSTTSAKRSTGAFRYNKKTDVDGLRSWSVLPDGSPQAITQKNTRKVAGKTLFCFDSVFGEDRSTKDVYDTVGSPIVKAVVGGHNGTIFAYGQTGSGKTFTMQGGEPFSAGDGMIQMVAKDLFQYIQAHPDRQFSVFASHIEIYNEQVYELLIPNNGDLQENTTGQPVSSSVLSVREHPARGGVFVNCREVEVPDARSLIDQLRIGCSNRVVSSTEMNARTSRSHGIFRIIVKSKAKANSTTENAFEQNRIVRASVLNLVDLAGSENSRTAGTKGLRHREAGKINKSLLSLSQVINALGLPPNKRPAYINYRDSKLTRILQSSLSGNALMAILCCISPSKEHVEETRSTLKFAARAKLVKTDAKINEIVDDSVTIKRLQQELLQAKHALEALEEREQAAETTTMEAAEEVRNMKSMLFGGGGKIPVFTSRPIHPSRSIPQAVRPSDKSTRSAPISNVVGEQGLKRRHQYVASIEEPSDGESFDHSESLSAFDAYHRTPGHTALLRTAIDDLQHSRVSGSYDIYYDGQERVVQERSSTPKMSGSQPPPDEVLVMNDASMGGWGYRSLEYQLNASHQQIRFLESKLNKSQELIELLFKDVEDARNCIHQLVFKNVSYISKIKKLKDLLRTEQHEKSCLTRQRYNLLKFSMYLALIMFVFGHHQLFLAMVMFIWLTLEAYT